MNKRAVTFLLVEMAQHVAKGGDPEAMADLMVASSAKRAKAIKDYVPVLKAKLEKNRADLVAKIAEIDVALEEIKVE